MTNAENEDGWTEGSAVHFEVPPGDVLVAGKEYLISFSTDFKSGISTTTLRSSLYRRLRTLEAAARSKNQRLIDFALAEIDKWGLDDEKPSA